MATIAAYLRTIALAATYKAIMLALSLCVQVYFERQMGFLFVDFESSPGASKEPAYL